VVAGRPWLVSPIPRRGELITREKLTVSRVDHQLQVGDGVLISATLVELRPADHLVGRS
jgi:hypothetical protein